MNESISQFVSGAVLVLASLPLLLTGYLLRRQSQVYRVSAIERARRAQRVRSLYGRG